MIQCPKCNMPMTLDQGDQMYDCPNDNCRISIPEHAIHFTGSGKNKVIPIKKKVRSQYVQPWE